MGLYILRWNPEISSYTKEIHEDLKSHVEHLEFPKDFDWSIKEWKSLKKNDFFIMQQVGTKKNGIAMIGKFCGTCYEGPSWEEKDKTCYYAKILIMNVFDCNKENILPAKKYKKLFPEIDWMGGPSGIRLDDELGMRLMDQIEQDMIAEKYWDEKAIFNFMQFKGKVGEVVNWGVSRQSPFEDGSLLIFAKQNYLKDPTVENLKSLMYCLNQSSVWVPVNVRKVKSKNATFPLPLENEDGVVAFAAYTSSEHYKGQYSEDENATMVRIPFLNCIQFVLDEGHTDEIVLDAYTAPLELDKEALTFIKQMNVE